METTTHNLKVLLVDDSEAALLAISGLANQLGFLSFTLKNPLEIENAVKGIEPDVIVTDFQMPEMNGFELISLVRSKKEFNEIPIILLTGSDDPELCKKAIEAGADDFILKSEFTKMLFPKMLALARIRNKNKVLTRLKQIEALHLLIVAIKHEFGNSLMKILGFSMRISQNLAKGEEATDLGNKIYEVCLHLGDLIKRLDSVVEIKVEKYTGDTKMFKF